MPKLGDEVIVLATAGRLDELKQRLADDPAIARRRGPGAETLLHIVARQWPKLAAGPDIAVALLDAGADVNAADADGLRPIQGATGDPKLTAVLLDAGADTRVYAANHMHMSPIEVCLYYGLPEEARLLADAGAGVDLRVAAGLGDTAYLRSCLDQNTRFRADSIGLPGQTGPRMSLAEGVAQALSYAARNGQAATAELLLDHGADIDALAPHFEPGCTPLHQAVLGGHLHIAELLIRRGARLDVLDDGHRSTPRQWAEHQHKPEIADLLATHGG